MSDTYACVIDAESRYVTFVLLVNSVPQYYTLKEGETLVDAQPPAVRDNAGSAGFVSPVWDGSTWVESATEEEIAAWEAENPDPNARTLEELRADKVDELSAACTAAIVAGMDVDTSQGVEHFALQETDQINLTTALSAIQSGAEGYPYHADGQLCRMFTAAEIQAIAAASVQHKLYHTTLCNHLLVWARRAATAEELASITYSADNLPDDLAANMAAVLATAKSDV